MATRKLDRIDWAAYFDNFSQEMIRSRQPARAEIRVLSPEIGAQAEVEWTPLMGITYDPKDNLLEVQVEHIDHLIYQPQEIFIDETNAGVPKSIEVISGTTKEIIEVR